MRVILFVIATVSAIGSEQVCSRAAWVTRLNIIEQTHVSIQHELWLRIIGMCGCPILFFFPIFPWTPSTEDEFFVVSFIKDNGLFRRHPVPMVARKFVMCLTQGMGTHQSNGILPLQSHGLQKCGLDLSTRGSNWDTVSRSGTLISIKSSPIKSSSHIQSVSNSSLTNDCISSNYPKISLGDVGILLVVQLCYFTVVAPDSLKARVSRVIKLYASIRTHSVIAVSIVVHEIMGNKADDSTVEMTKVVLVVYGVGNCFDIIVDFIVGRLVDAGR
mmetsp:Transcript_5800/g.12892  ORF Transcript_5800/g.12892 Transcript_5800/m.12892 type:complete len:273 (+) Transcript_5800:388-1206(+)